MQAVIDTVVMNHNCRGMWQSDAPTLLQRCVSTANLSIAVDPDHAIIHEWERTAGREAVQLLVVEWFESGALFTVLSLGRIPTQVNRQLRAAGFDGTIDKLMLRVAMVTADRILVSDDSDFWDPTDPTHPGRVGDYTAPVASIINVCCGVRVHCLPQFLALLGNPVDHLHARCPGARSARADLARTRGWLTFEGREVRTRSSSVLDPMV